MKIQIRPADGQSFWDLSNTCWENLKCEHLSNRYGEWVSFLGRDWLCKRTNRSLAVSEVVGYQIAEALALPLQPWLGFYQPNAVMKASPPFSVGFLVERWPAFSKQAQLAYPARTHPDLVARALALLALRGGGDLEWMTDADQKELRLFDLELIGPQLPWPASSLPLEPNFGTTECYYNQAEGMAAEAGLYEEFNRYVHFLLNFDFGTVLDLSGHPEARETELAVTGYLAACQRQLREILNHRLLFRERLLVNRNQLICRREGKVFEMGSNFLVGVRCFSVARSAKRG